MINFTPQEALNLTLCKDFKSFVRKVFSEISGAAEYQDNWHVDLICSHIIDMRDGIFDRLVVNIPPRYMKSIICSVALPAWLLGHQPETNIICVSYADDLANKHANDCRNIMNSQWYKDVFPGTHIDPSRRAVDNFRTTRNGGRFSTSPGGTLTGMGAEWIIIDDPLKPADANSDIMREKVNCWYGSTLLSRFNQTGSGKILVIMQRLHENDMAGYLLSEDDSYRHIKLSMIAEKDEVLCLSPASEPNPKYKERKVGDLLHPERDPQEIVDKHRKNMGEYEFAGQYQQNPAPKEGGFVKKQWLKYYQSSITPRLTKVLLSWDTASKTGTENAYSACVTIGITNDRKMHVLDCFRARMEFNELSKTAAEMYKKVKAAYSNIDVEVLVEDASSGTQLIQDLKFTHAINATAISATVSKQFRMAGITPQIENGTCLFPSFNPVWWADFEKELLTFPASKFKDQCDALSQGIEYAKTTAINSPAFGQAMSMIVSAGGWGRPTRMGFDKNTSAVMLSRHRY